MSAPYDDTGSKASGKKEKPCRACTDFQSWMKTSGKKSKQGAAKEPPMKRSSAECPLDVNELGRNTWSFLHTMAAYFPEKPSVQEKTDMNQFIHLFSKFYPCSHCAEDFRESLKKNRPDTASSDNLAQWMCKMHNEVNQKLGKPEYDCSKVTERWKDGWKDGSCD